MNKLVVRLPLLLLLGLATALSCLAQSGDDQVPADYLLNARHSGGAVPPRGHGNGVKLAGNQNGVSSEALGIPNIDSLINFSGHFSAAGVDQNGNPRSIWFYNMVGRSPAEESGQQQGDRTTTIKAPIIPVSLVLRKANGSPRFVYDVTPFIEPTLNSPVFQKFPYTSSKAPTQISDAIQRAEFFDQADPGWHTVLSPNVKTARVMTIDQDPTCGQAKGHCNYLISLHADGTCCRFVLVDDQVFGNALFPANFPFSESDLQTPVGAAENDGDITTKDISTFLFPNTYLFLNGNPNVCCVLGYHTYDFEPGIPSNGNLERRYVLNYSSWISPGLFRGGFEDVTALSHEMAEIYNDPFVASDGIHNITPWWLSPNGNCQDDLEVGDVIEGLPRGVFPITMNGMTYHPQNEALLPWFEFQSPSSAISGAYSYPDISTLTALSAPQNKACK